MIPDMTPPRHPHVLLACPGLEHAHRGFETFARECFETLRGRPGLTIGLVKGTGARLPGEDTVPTLTRDTRLAQRLAHRVSREPFIVEHLAFSLALIPMLRRRRPDVVYFSEWHVGRVLASWRRVSGQPLRLVFCNGALAPGGYGHLDLVQQLTPGAIEFTAARGEPTGRQWFLPLGASVAPRPTLLSGDERARLRRRLGLPVDRQIVLSVGALNTAPKRVDYVIEEIAQLPERRPYLLLLGQPETDTPAIRELAATRLGRDGHDIRTVQGAAMTDYYLASDVFVLGSLWESFGRVLVEAQASGLACLAHDHSVMRWVLGDEGQTADLTRRGAVGRWLRSLEPGQFAPNARRRRHSYAYRRFSWDTLADGYVEMLRSAAGLPAHRA